MVCLDLHRPPLSELRRLHPDGKITSGHEKHDIVNESSGILSKYEDFYHEDNVFDLTIGEKLNTMNTGDDESTSGLNGRLRPRKSNNTIESPIGRSSRKADSKPIQKRNSPPLKTPPNRTDDLNKRKSSQDTQFLCPYCDRKFVSKLSASKHARRIHLSISKQDNFINCLYCNLTEADPHDVIRHMIDSHPNQYFACLDCHTRFPSTTELAEHKLNVCEKQKAPYRSKLRQKHSHNSTKNKKKLIVDQKDKFSNENKEYINDNAFNGIVISCELKPSHIQDAADIEDNITTNLILPPGKSLASTNLEKNAVIVLDDVQWNKRITPNFTFHNTDADQILSRLGVVHRSPRVGESTRRAWLKMLDENNPKFEKCFDTNFYTRVSSNVQENLTRFLDGSFNFNPDAESTIKTRKSKSSVVINTAEGFPILLAYEQFSRHVLDGYMPRQMAPRHKWKWDAIDNSDNALVDPNALKSDSHVNNCIITLVSSLDIWTQLRMRRKFEDVFNKSSSQKTEINNIITSELKEILESREIPSSSSQIVKYTNTAIVRPEDRPELPGYLGLSPVQPKCEFKPAVLSGEWVRPRCYVCCACGAQTRDSRGLTSHMSTQHPNAQVQHYEIVGEPLLNADIFKHLYVPPNQSANRTRPPRGFRDCTKCKKSIALEDMHQHMLDCAGDTPTVRRKCRYRPFGVRKRRPRLPDNTIRKKIRKEIRSRHRQKGHTRSRPKIRSEVGDAETIRKMIADLPAKRVRVSLNSTLNVKTRKVIETKRNSLKIKRQNGDGLKNIITRSKRVNTYTKITDDDTQSVNTQSDDDDEPLKRNTKLTSAKNSHEKVANTSTASTTFFNKTDSVNVNATEVNVREHSGRNHNKNKNNQQERKDSSESDKKDDNSENNVSHRRSDPLKHSIARITSNDNLQVNSEQKTNIDPLHQSNSVTQYAADTLRIFEDEAKSDKVDKPPLQDNSKALDPGGVQKSKVNKPRKRLNDCIAMLKQKSSQSQEYQSMSEDNHEKAVKMGNFPRDDQSAHMPNYIENPVTHEHPTTTPRTERNKAPPRGVSPRLDGSLLQVPHISSDAVNNTQQPVVDPIHPEMLRGQNVMFPQMVHPEFMTRLAAEHLNYETLRQVFSAQAARALTVNTPPNVLRTAERRRSHGDPEFAQPRSTQNEKSKRRSSRLKSDSRTDYQSLPQYPGVQTGYIDSLPPELVDLVDNHYTCVQPSSFDFPLPPLNSNIYHIPPYPPGAVTSLNLPISKPYGNLNSLPFENQDNNLRMRMGNMSSEVIQTQQTHYTSQSPDSRRKRWNSSSSDVTSHSDYDSSHKYSQKSPDVHGADSHIRSQVNNNYIVSPDAPPKLSPRSATTSRRPHRDSGQRNWNCLESETLEIQRQRNIHSRTVNKSPDYDPGVDRVSASYYQSRNIHCPSLSPLCNESLQKPSEICYSQVPSKCNDSINASFLEPPVLEIHRKGFVNMQNKLDIRLTPEIQEPFWTTELKRQSQQSHNIESDERKLNIMNTASERTVGHRRTPSTETERIPPRESPTLHHMENILSIDRSQQRYMKKISTPEQTPASEMVPLDLRSQHKILSDISEKSQPRLYVRDIAELRSPPASIKGIHSNEPARLRTLSQNLHDDVSHDLSIYGKPSTSGFDGQPTNTNLEYIRSDKNYDTNIIQTSIINHSAASRSSIPTITVSAPDNGNTTEVTKSSAQIKHDVQSSIHEPEKVQPSDKINFEKQDTNNLILTSQTPPADPNNSVILTQKTTQTNDKRKLVPKEIIDVIDDLPQEQRERLLDILPQFVRMSNTQNEPVNQVGNKSDDVNKSVSSNTLSPPTDDSTNVTVSKLTVNTNLIPTINSNLAPSSVLPKKRHSPNVTYSSHLTIAHTDVICPSSSLVTPVHLLPVQNVTSAEKNSELSRNIEQPTNMDHLIDPYTGVMQSRTDLLNRENNQTDAVCITPTDSNIIEKAETSTTLEPIKPPMRSKNSNEKTSLLRMVRFNSSRKSQSEDKHLLHLKDKTTHQKDPVSQKDYEEYQYNVQHNVDEQREKNLTIETETLRCDQNSSTQTLDNPVTTTLDNSRNNTEIEKQNNIELITKVNSNDMNIARDNFLDLDTSLMKRGPVENFQPTKISNLDPTPELYTAFEYPSNDESTVVGLQTQNKVNIQVIDSVEVESNQKVNEKSCTVYPNESFINEQIISLKNSSSDAVTQIENSGTLTEPLKSSETDFNSDDEDVSLAEIVKLRRPKQTIQSSENISVVTKRKKDQKSINNSKKISISKKRSAKKKLNTKNILTINTTDKLPNNNRRAKICNDAIFCSDSKNISTNDETLKQDSISLSKEQINELNKIVPINSEEFTFMKDTKVTDNISTCFNKIEDVHYTDLKTEEKVNAENKRENKVHIQIRKSPSVQDETIKGKTSYNIKMNQINSSDETNSMKDKINSSVIEKTSNSLALDVATADTCNITDNSLQKSLIETPKNLVSFQKPILTKKQRIFSKMLCDDREISISYEKDSNIFNDPVKPLNIESYGDSATKKGKPIKRKQSPLRKRKNKKHMKHLHAETEDASDSSQSLIEIRTENKPHANQKEEVNNCLQDLTCIDLNIDSLHSHTDTTQVNKQTPNSEKRKSEMEDFATTPKKSKLADSETIVDEHHQNNCTGNVVVKLSETTELATAENIDVIMVKTKQKDSTNFDDKKRPEPNNIPETRTTCYNRQIDNKVSGPSSTTRHLENYDPYNIDLDETIDVTEPAARKTKQTGTSKKYSQSAKPKSPTSFVPSNLSSSDSESSKSDVPLQKYVEEKRMQEQMEAYNALEHLKTPDRAVDSLNVSETAETANNLDIYVHINQNIAEKAKSIFIPEEDIITSKNNLINSKSYNDQQTDHQSTSTEGRSEMIDPDVAQPEIIGEIDNEDHVANCLQNKENSEISESKHCKESKEYLESKECSDRKDFKESEEYKESDECKDNDGLKECNESEKSLECVEFKDIEESLEGKKCNESEREEIKKVCKEVEELTKNEECKELNECVENKETKECKEKKRRRSNITPNADTADTSKTNEQPSTDKYMENFGFFSERKPRKSNLLATKKITETFHIINEGDDAYFSSKERPIKKSTNRETTKSTDGEISAKIVQDTKSNDEQITLKQLKVNDVEIKRIGKVSDINADKNLNIAEKAFHKELLHMENKVQDVREATDAIATPPKLKDYDQQVDLKEHTSQPINLQSPVHDTDLEHTNIETKKSNKNKAAKIRPPGYKEKMYPDIEEIDLFEDKFDKIKRKSRTQAAAAKQTNSVDTTPSNKSRKKIEKKKKKYAKKSYHSSVVPTKAALKGFDSIKISISTQDLNMPTNISPPRQKKRKRSSSKKKRERKDSDSSSRYDSDIHLRDPNVQERDIYEFKDNDDAELLELRPSTVMDRFRSLNKEKSKHKDKTKDKEGHKECKPKRVDDLDDDELCKLKQFNNLPTGDHGSKPTKIDHDVNVNRCNRQTTRANYKFNDEILSGNVENIQSPVNSKDTKKSKYLNQEEEDVNKTELNDENFKPDDDDDDDDDNVCLVSRSRFVPPSNDDSSFEWNGSPESGFVHMSDGIDCSCLPESDGERVCDSSNCIYRKTNPEKNAVMGKIFKNNAVRRDTTEINTEISPKANLDQLFDSLLETNSNDNSSEKNISGRNNRETSPVPGPSSKILYSSYDKNDSLSTYTEEHLKSQTSHNSRNCRMDIRSKDTEDAFTRLLNKDETSNTPLPYVSPSKPGKDSISNNDDLYRKCILSHNEDACSSDSTDPSNKIPLVDEYVMMSFKITQTEDPGTIVEECKTNLKSCSDDDESDLDTESNDIIVLRRYVATKSHGAQTDDILNTQNNYEYGVRKPRPGDYSMMSAKSTQTRKHKSKSKQDDGTTSDEDLSNALEKTIITLKKFVTTTTKSTQTDHRIKSRKSSKHEDSSCSLKLSEPSTSKDKRSKKKKVHKMEMKMSLESGDESSAKEDDDMYTATSKNQYEPIVAERSPSRKSEERISPDLECFEDDAGVARQRARRKCTVGKQNVLAEHWSSESEVEPSGPRPSSASSVIVSGSRRRRGRKREGKRSNRGSRGRDGEERAPPHGPSIRARPALTHGWSSDNEEDDTGTQPQHGWIVGDSHKKLVTLLANAKGRKRNNNEKRQADE